MMVTRRPTFQRVEYLNSKGLSAACTGRNDKADQQIASGDFDGNLCVSRAVCVRLTSESCPTDTATPERVSGHGRR